MITIEVFGELGPDKSPEARTPLGSTFPSELLPLTAPTKPAINPFFFFFFSSFWGVGGEEGEDEDEETKLEAEAGEDGELSDLGVPGEDVGVPLGESEGALFL